MSRNIENLDRLFADADDAGDLADLDARQVEALRRASQRRKEARQRARDDG